MAWFHFLRWIKIKTYLKSVDPAVVTEGTDPPPLGGFSGWKTTVCPLLVTFPLMFSKYDLGYIFKPSNSLVLLEV